jgi:hypothetical protein
VTRFNDLSDEVLLIVCGYLTPAHVIKTFLNYDDRMFSCISEYRDKMNLAKCSYADFQYFLKLLSLKQLRPSILILSNSKISTQIQIIINELSTYSLRFVHHLSLLECIVHDLDDIDLLIEIFDSLQSLIITESASHKNTWKIAYSTIETLRNSIFDNSFGALIELELSTFNGIILDKKLHVNKHLKRLTISLQKIDDLLILLDGLVPNLIVLNVTLCKAHTSKRSLLPQGWPRRYMYHLTEFQLITNKDVPFTFDHFKGIVMTLIKVHKFTLDVKQWTDNHQQFIEGYQIDMLIRQFMTQLRYFHCFIQTTNEIDIWVNNCHGSIKYF